jgi:TM2 domain-containing membrane protein YozV
MAGWYYAVGGKQLGPVSQPQLKDLAASGKLPPASLVWTDGMPNWVAAHTIPGLFDSASPGTLPAAMPKTLSDASTTKIVAGVCGILLGQFGVHKFVIGMTTPAVVMLAVTLGGYALAPCTFFASLLAPTTMHAIGLIEGILYLVKSDQEFHQRYMVEKHDWF